MATLALPPIPSPKSFAAPVATPPARAWSDEISFDDLDEPSTYLGSLGVVLESPEPAHVPQAKPVIESEDWSHAVVNVACKPVVDAEQAILATVGLETDRKDLFFDEGTAFLKVGHANAIAERARLDALPDAETEIARFQALIAGENRRDRIVDLCEYRLDSSGNLSPLHSLDESPGAELNEIAYSQLVTGCESKNINRGLSKRTRMVRRVRARDLPTGD